VTLKPTSNTGGGGGGSGTVTSVTSADTSISVATGTTTPVLTVAPLNMIAANSAASGNVALNSHKLTGLAAGSGNGDSVRYEQVVLSGATAAGDLGSTYPNPTVISGAHLSAASVPIASLADPTTGKVIGSASNAAASVYPPGFEIGYDQITASVNITGTGSTTPNTIITSSSYTFDGSPVILSFYSSQVALPTVSGDQVTIALWEGATDLGILATMRTESATQEYKPVFIQYRFTPTVGAHVYLVRAWATATTGTPSIGAGAGGVNTNVPAFTRFTKV
jgi:hypothetical protein